MFNAWFGASFIYIYFVCVKSTEKEKFKQTFFYSSFHIFILPFSL